MPGMHTAHDVTLTWFSVQEAPRGRESLGDPIISELLPRRRTWTTVQDLINASTDTEIWRQPTQDEWAAWELGEPKPAQQCDAEAAWLVVTAGEPGLGAPTRMAVRLQEQLVR